jgi:hypothetical protein
MEANFNDLELLAQQPIDFDVNQLLMEMAPAYETAPIHELFELLEGAVESYTLARNHLTVALRESAEKEIGFYLALLKQRLDTLLEPENRLQSQLQFV